MQILKQKKREYFRKLTKYRPKNPCVKQMVKVVIVSEPLIYGTNNIQEGITNCPRIEKGSLSGEDYNLCVEVCKQSDHAEVSAIKEAARLGVDIKGAEMNLIGHTYCCEKCLDSCRLAGISNINIFNEKGDITRIYNFSLTTSES